MRTLLLIASILAISFLTDVQPARCDSCPENACYTDVDCSTGCSCQRSEGGTAEGVCLGVSDPPSAPE